MMKHIPAIVISIIPCNPSSPHKKYITTACCAMPDNFSAGCSTVKVIVYCPISNGKPKFNVGSKSSLRTRRQKTSLLLNEISRTISPSASSIVTRPDNPSTAASLAALSTAPDVPIQIPIPDHAYVYMSVRMVLYNYLFSTNLPISGPVRHGEPFRFFCDNPKPHRRKIFLPP